MLGVLRGRVGGRRRAHHDLSALMTAAAVALLFACGDALQQDELDCEEAVSHLEGCCRGFNSSGLRCVDKQGCDSSEYPDISEQQSACIRAESCQELVATGVCERAQNALPGSGGRSSQVCP
jgi:hypothetical protein